MLLLDLEGTSRTTGEDISKVGEVDTTTATTVEEDVTLIVVTTDTTDAGTGETIAGTTVYPTSRQLLHHPTRLLLPYPQLQISPLHLPPTTLPLLPPTHHHHLHHQICLLRLLHHPRNAP